MSIKFTRMLMFSCLVFPSVALAQLPPKPELKPTVLTLRPAGEPKPALKYSLLPSRQELVPGNAAIFYHRAIEMNLLKRLSGASDTNRKSAKPGAESIEMVAYRWITGPLDAIPVEEARKYLSQHENVLHEAELGAFRMSSDWEFDLRKEGFELLIPEIQEMRSIGRLVMLKARVALLEKKTDEAMHWLQVGFAMSRHVSEGPILIQSLVGVATAVETIKTFEVLIQAEGSPNMYWALADRQRPFIDLAPAFEGERFMLEREIPSLRDLDSGPWSNEQARRFIDEVQTKLARLNEISLLRVSESAQGGGLPKLQDLPGRLSMAAIIAKVYPEAKRGLIAQGKPAAEVEAMPTVQVAALYSIQSYYQIRDDVFKWTSLPYWQSQEKMREASRKCGIKLPGGNPLLAMFTMLLPAIENSRLAAVRTERFFNALECIEAIRIYAASHHGAFPTSLDAMTETPVPLDPATGKAFEYKVQGDTATLSAPLPPGAPDHFSYKLFYELKMAR